MMGVCASEPHGIWVTEMLDAYRNRHFLQSDGGMDMTTNVKFVTSIMASGGFRQDGSEQEYKDLHVFPVDYFSPQQTTGEYFRTENTYCEHLGLNSWLDQGNGWKTWINNMVGQKYLIYLIKLKRKLLG